MTSEFQPMVNLDGQDGEKDIKLVEYILRYILSFMWLDVFNLCRRYFVEWAEIGTASEGPKTQGKEENVEVKHMFTEKKKNENIGDVI